MIKLHRLNGQEFTINSELIETCETNPDTIITLYTGNKFVVQESAEKVRDLIIEYKKEIFSKRFEKMG